MKLQELKKWQRKCLFFVSANENWTSSEIVSNFMCSVEKPERITKTNIFTKNTDTLDDDDKKCAIIIINQYESGCCNFICHFTIKIRSNRGYQMFSSNSLLKHHPKSIYSSVFFKREQKHKLNGSICS